MLPRSVVISVPLSVVVEVLDSSVLLVLRQLKSAVPTASEFTFGSPAYRRTPTVKVRSSSAVSIRVKWRLEMNLRHVYD